MMKIRRSLQVKKQTALIKRTEDLELPGPKADKAKMTITLR